MFKIRSRRIGAIATALLLFSTAARAETSSVRIGLQYGLGYLSVVLAAEQKLFDKRAKELGLSGLDVTLNRVSGSAGMNDALLSGSIEAGAAGTTGALIAWDKTRGKQHVKSIAGISVLPITLFTNRPNIHSLKDFTTNDKIAVPAFNSPQAILLRALAARDLGSQDKANALMVALPHPDATAALLAGEAISGYFSTPPFSQIVERDPRVRKVLASASLLGGEESTTSFLVATRGFVEDNPKVAQALFLGLAEACAQIRSDPKAAIEIYLKSEKVLLPPEEIEKIIIDGVIVFQVEPQGLMSWAKHLHEQGALTKMPEKWQDLFFPLIGDRKGS